MNNFDKEKFLIILENRFQNNMQRHPDFNWSFICSRLENKIDKLKILYNMEATGGEPDVVGFDITKDEIIFVDCSIESPAGRRSLCFDREALDSRKENKPTNNVIDTAFDIGIELLSEAQYRELQKLGNFDLKTSSWIQTPPDIRKLGGALFADFRYNHVFVYHNGASSYYSARGFRGILRV
jgi:hypothetical protein